MKRINGNIKPWRKEVFKQFKYKRTRNKNYSNKYHIHKRSKYIFSWSIYICHVKSCKTQFSIFFHCCYCNNNTVLPSLFFKNKKVLTIFAWNFKMVLQYIAKIEINNNNKQFITLRKYNQLIFVSLYLTKKLYNITTISNVDAKDLQLQSVTLSLYLKIWV